MNIEGERYGQWVVLKHNGGGWWTCECACGVVRSVRGTDLRRGRSRSCGCSVKRRVPHGGSGTHEYRVWIAMKVRCFDPTHKKYPIYGGRGITVCRRWRDDFSVFLKDMGECPDGHTIERIDSNGNYEPSNCRWATVTEQNRNTNRNRMLEYQGERMSMAAWAERVGLPYQTLNTRINTMGWSVERALSTPHRTLAKRVTK